MFPLNFFAAIKKLQGNYSDLMNATEGNSSLLPVESSVQQTEEFTRSSEGIIGNLLTIL
jgi:hypothetical protein